MKKDRNSFFQESQYFNQGGFNAQPFLNNPNTFQSYANQGFYSGVMPPTNSNNFSSNNYDFSELDSRLSKIERQINRLDARLSKLESTSLYSTDEIDNTTNVYMV